MTSKPSSSRSTANSTSGVRRNLFHHLRDIPQTTPPQQIHDDSSEIVAKDDNGNYEILVPSLPPLEDNQAEEETGNNDRDKLDAKMLELYKDKSLQPGEPAELMAAIQANLKRKVASLDQDNWMFEAEQAAPDG